MPETPLRFALYLPIHRRMLVRVHARFERHASHRYAGFEAGFNQSLLVTLIKTSFAVSSNVDYTQGQKIWIALGHGVCPLKMVDTCSAILIPEDTWGVFRAYQQSVGVFTSSALPWAVRVAEVHLHTRSGGELCMSRHFLALVVGEALPLMRREKLDLKDSKKARVPMRGTETAWTQSVQAVEPDVLRELLPTARAWRNSEGQ